MGPSPIPLNDCHLPAFFFNSRSLKNFKAPYLFSLRGVIGPHSGDRRPQSSSFSSWTHLREMRPNRRMKKYHCKDSAKAAEDKNNSGLID